FLDSGYVYDMSITEAKPVNQSTQVEEDVGQRIGLERDMQAALRLHLEQLEPGLTITDDGAERSVNSGFIDITARDSSGGLVVIELKAGAAGQRAIAQILSYMGDIASEEENAKVRGILVASEFDAKARAAAKMVPNLALLKYSVRFFFSEGHN
ncbi:MAG TPA: endonuclease NucS domain-containing protein, partial [Terriglobales bacterium]|nr:endonuclease NucS domain-containing protein [Terriglobales bacterium]